jgi:hypothetical protein
MTVKRRSTGCGLHIEAELFSCTEPPEFDRRGDGEIQVESAAHRSVE